MPVDREKAVSARDQYIAQANYFQSEIARYEQLAREAADAQQRASYQRAAESAKENRDHVQGLIRAARFELARSVERTAPAQDREANPEPQRPEPPQEKRYSLDEMLSHAKEEARREREQERSRGLERER